MENRNDPLEITRQEWDQAAARFDDEPDHGLRDPGVRQAWTHLLRDSLPLSPAAVLDIGCGTGTLSVVLAGLGYGVTGIDLSPAMIALAKRKAAAAGAAVRFKVMDAAFPRLAVARYDALVCRHVAWALPEIEQVLRRWARLLKRGGSLLMIEGFWHTGSGIHAQDAANLIPPGLELRTVRDLSQNTGLWGGPVQDERYLLSAVKVS